MLVSSRRAATATALACVVLIGCPDGSSPPDADAAVARTEPDEALGALSPPDDVAAVLATEPVAAGLTALAVWVADRDLDPALRYAALRRLEEADATEAVKAAMALLSEDPGFLRLNAIGVLARSDAPGALTALEALSDEDRLVAEAMIRHSGSSEEGRR